MKRLSLILLAMLLLLLLISCTEESTDTTKSTENGGDTVSTVDSSNTDVKNDPEEGAELVADIESSTTEYYETLDCGEYEGDEFDYAGELKSYYAVMKSYSSLCRRTEKGSDYSEEIFKDSYVVALYRHFYFRVPGKEIGYRNIRISGGKVCIDRHVWDAQFTEQEYGDFTTVTYLRVPKADIEGDENLPFDVLDEGEITVSEVTTWVNDTAVATVENTGYENGTAWLLETSELEGFLAEQGLGKYLNWNKKCECECGFYYCSTQYKILAIYLELDGTGFTTYDRPIGYGEISVNGNSISIKRSYRAHTMETKKIKVFEFVAINTEELEGLNGKPTSITVKNAEHVRRGVERRGGYYSSSVNVEEKDYGYYDMLDLGVFFYDSELTGDNAYRIITSYGELSGCVDNPFVEADIFDNSYIVVIKTNNYDTNKINGIRDVYFNGRGTLCATIEYGSLDEMDSVYFPYNYSYICVPKEKLDIEGKELTGELFLKVNIDVLGGYSHICHSESEKYLALNQVWFINTHRGVESFEFLHSNIDLDPYYRSGTVLLIYYGKLAENAEFYNLKIEGERLYIDVIHKGTEYEKGPYFHIIELDSALFDGAPDSLTVNITKYTRTLATRIEKDGELTESYLSFYATHYGENRLTKTPEFDYLVIDNAEQLSTVVTEYTNIDVTTISTVDFENSYVIAYNVVQGCTGCAYATSFENARMGNGVLYIDKYLDSHGGRDALTRALHLIIVPKEYITQEIKDVVFISEPGYLMP